MGYCVELSKVRESVPDAERAETRREDSHPRKLPALMHVLHLLPACKKKSWQCYLAWVSATKIHMYITEMLVPQSVNSIKTIVKKEKEREKVYSMDGFIRVFCGYARQRLKIYG